LRRICKASSIRSKAPVAFAESVTAAQYAGAKDRTININWANGKPIRGDDYLLQITIPNVFFHITTAYAILRHNGVDVSKKDFLGTINWVD